MADRVVSGISIIDANVTDITNAVQALDDGKKLLINYVGEGKILIAEVSKDV